MRLLSFALLLGASALGAASEPESSEFDVPLRDTVFDGKKVPAMVELTATTFEKEIVKSNYTVVKFYSPWCPHCLDFAPTYQTLYEFYHTSRSPKPDQSMLSFYDLRFTAINCIAYGDLCGAQNVSSYPMTHLYKNGRFHDTVRGGKGIKVIAEMIEKEMEKAKPGTRPSLNAIDFPAPGATALPKAAAPSVAPSAVPSATNSQAGTEAKSSLSSQAQSASITASAATTETTAGTAAKYLSVSATKIVLKTKAAKPTGTPNEKGLSVSLNAESFQNLVTMSQEPWFIKFYAPWCHHCQAMASNWQQLAKEMKGRLNIGEVNCDAESRLCKDVKVRGYPTIHFFKGGERVEYNGLRGLGDFINYSEKALDICTGVRDVDLESFKALEQKEDVIFVYFYDFATTTEDFMALERLPLSLIGHAKIVKTKDPKMYERFKITTWPRLLVSRESRPTYYTPLMPKEMRDTRQVLTWMKSVWLPIVPELTASNARDIMDNKIVVLGILNREDEESFQIAKREMKSAAGEWMDKQIVAFQGERQELRDAKQLRIEEAEDRNDQGALRRAKNIRIDMNMSERKEVAFAWVDGIFWQRWIRTTYGIDVKDGGDRVIINDEDSRRYWDNTISGMPIVPSRTSILETIGKVTHSPPKINPKLTISSFEKIFFDIRVTFTEHPIMSICCIVGLALGGTSWIRGRLRRRGGHFRLDESLPIKEIKDGLLGTTANGKKD